MVRGEKGERGASQIAADGNGWRNVSAHTKPTIPTVKPKRRELRRFLAQVRSAQKWGKGINALLCR